MAITAGGDLNSVPSSQQQTLSTNYLDLASTANQGWAQQYLPDLMEKEAEVFGPRTISGFLSKVGAEESMASDRVVWSEQGRLHLSYKGNINSASAGADPGGGSGTVTSVGITSVSNEITVNNSPVTSSGDIDLALSATGVVAGTYGDSSNTVELIIDAAGRITSAVNTPIQLLPSGGLTSQVVTYNNQDELVWVYSDGGTW